MAAEVKFHPDAIEEATAAREWYEQRSPKAAAAFVDALDRAVDAIAESPMRWSEHLFGTRRYLLYRFPYVIVYRVAGGEAHVLAVAHAKRKPGYWRHRRM